MKSVILTTMMLIVVLLSGCATSGSYCDIARPVRPSIDDQMTPETKRQILTENEKLQKLCGVKP
ncbi:hypothetical protein [Agrobacterium pusense]|uniref:hypothetical protein n=1 Tax=Agrobacterium pusense TaxID=648995 RepID=UPI0010ADB8EE|nr:hypothetical protein [Agrobacterium pusense]WCK22715.1 hypothetical protein CFBP5496_0008080 [Agrobacterium pusense]